MDSRPDQEDSDRHLKTSTSYYAYLNRLRLQTAFREGDSTDHALLRPSSLFP